MSYCWFCRLGGPHRENQRKRKERLVRISCQKTKKAVEHEGDGDTNCYWGTWSNPQRLGKKTENRRPFRLQHCWGQPEYWEEFRRPVETCHSDFSCSYNHWNIGMPSKCLEKILKDVKIQERHETIQTTALLNSAVILSEVSRIKETCRHLILR